MTMFGGQALLGSLVGDGLALVGAMTLTCGLLAAAGVYALLTTAGGKTFLRGLLGRGPGDRGPDDLR